MSYDDNPQAVRLDGADRDDGRNHLAAAVNELGQLAELVARTLGRADDAPGSGGGFTRVVIESGAAASDEPVDVTVSTFCHGTECLYVYDALEGVCRPCGPDDHACDPVSHG